MSERLDLEDWKRVLNALSQFRHNPLYAATYDKVHAIVSELDGG